MKSYNICLSLIYFTTHTTFSVHTCCCKWQNFILFCGWVVFSYTTSFLWASLVAQLVKNLPAMWETGFDPWVGKIPSRREKLPTPVFWPGECHGLCGSPCSREESDTTEWLSLSFHNLFILLCRFYVFLSYPQEASRAQTVNSEFSTDAHFQTF